jgi:hypothetical protein
VLKPIGKLQIHLVLPVSNNLVVMFHNNPVAGSSKRNVFIRSIIDVAPSLVLESALFSCRPIKFISAKLAVEVPGWVNF